MPVSFVTARDLAFRLNGLPFPVSGVNCYFLAYCSDATRRAALTVAKQMGATVVRSWAFQDIVQYTPGSGAFQYFKDGALVINNEPDGLPRLDAVIKAAEDMGIKLILPLVNHWKDLGGMPAYVSCLLNGSTDVTEFYRNPVVREAFKKWVTAVLTRRNAITGRLYSEEPAIMAWELTNEARCEVAGGQELLLGWVKEMAAFVKGMDGNHLLALGDEGMFYKQGSGDLYDGSHGVDWSANLAVSGIDFGTFHSYPQHWGKNLNFASKWIKDHVAAAQRLNKPAVMEEFGIYFDNQILNGEDRDGWFANWLDTAQSNDCAGELLWMLGSKAEDVKTLTDEYVIYAADEVPSLAEFFGRKQGS